MRVYQACHLLCTIQIDKSAFTLAPMDNSPGQWKTLKSTPTNLVCSQPAVEQEDTKCDVLENGHVGFSMSS